MRIQLTLLALLLLAACALFTPDQREDVRTLVESQRTEWIDAHKRGDVTTNELEDALQRLADIEQRLEIDGTGDMIWELLLAFGGGAVAGKGGGPALRGVRNVLSAIRRKRQESKAKSVKAKG